MKSTLVLNSHCNTEFAKKINSKLVKNINSLILQKFGSKKDLKMSIIITAKLNLYYKSNSRNYLIRKAKIICNEYKNILKIPVTAVDCSTSDKIQHFKENIESSNIILVLGGDTFYLLYHLKKSGMLDVLRNHIINNNIIYVGCCSGSIILGSTIYPAYIYRRYPNFSRKYTLKNIYKKKYFNNKSNQKSLNLLKNKDVLTYCKTKRVTNKKKPTIINLNNRKKFICLHNKESLIIN